MLVSADHKDIVVIMTQETMALINWTHKHQHTTCCHQLGQECQHLVIAGPHTTQINIAAL